MAALVELVAAGPVAIFGRIDNGQVSLSCSLSGPAMFVGLPPLTLADAAKLGDKLAELARNAEGDHADRE